LSLERALRHRRLCAQVQTLSEAIALSRRFEDLLGESPPMRALYDQVARIADSEASVLITGESGTGKELVARASISTVAVRRAAGCCQLCKPAGDAIGK